MQYHEGREKRVKSGSGGKRRAYRDKRKAHVGRDYIPCKVSHSDEEVRVIKRGRGGNIKVILKRARYANVAVGGGKVKKVKIIKVLEASNPDFVRENIITKGVIIQTEIGKAKVTSRPGQHGVVNAVLLQEDKK